jgi:hypothetical protein
VQIFTGCWGLGFAGGSYRSIGGVNERDRNRNRLPLSPLPPARPARVQYIPCTRPGKANQVPRTPGTEVGRE